MKVFLPEFFYEMLLTFSSLSVYSSLLLINIYKHPNRKKSFYTIVYKFRKSYGINLIIIGIKLKKRNVA